MFSFTVEQDEGMSKKKCVHGHIFPASCVNGAEAGEKGFPGGESKRPCAGSAVQGKAGRLFREVFGVREQVGKDDAEERGGRAVRAAGKRSEDDVCGVDAPPAFRHARRSLGAAVPVFTPSERSRGLLGRDGLLRRSGVGKPPSGRFRGASCPTARRGRRG